MNAKDLMARRYDVVRQPLDAGKIVDAEREAVLRVLPACAGESHDE